MATALGITMEGSKVDLGFVQASTENAEVLTPRRPMENAQGEASDLASLFGLQPRRHRQRISRYLIQHAETRPPPLRVQALPMRVEHDGCAGMEQRGQAALPPVFRHEAVGDRPHIPRMGGSGFTSPQLS